MACISAARGAPGSTSAAELSGEMRIVCCGVVPRAFAHFTASQCLGTGAFSKRGVTRPSSHHLFEA